MENREHQENPNRYSATSENRFPPSPARLLPENHQLPPCPQNPSFNLNGFLDGFDQLSLSSPGHQSVGPSDSILGNRVQSAARGQNGNLYTPQELYDSHYPNLMSNQYEFTGHELVGPVDSVSRNRVQSGSQGQNSNLYGLGGHGSTYNEYLSYRNRMSNQNGFMGRPGSVPRSNLYDSFNPREFGSAYYFDPPSNLNGLIGRPGPVYNTNNRVNGPFSMGLHQNSLFRPEPMYALNGPIPAHLSPRQPNLPRARSVQPDSLYHQNGLSRAGPTYPARPNNGSVLADFRENIKDMAKDRDFSGFLRRKIEDGVEEDLKMIFDGVKDDVAGLMMNYCGSNVVQKLFKVCRPEQINYLLPVVLGDKYQFVQICFDNHGSVAMEKLLEKVTTDDQQASVLSALRGVVLKLSNDQNGHKVIQHCILNFPDIGVLIDEITRDCIEIAAHKSGCCVLQNCLNRVTQQQMDRLMLEISPNLVFLSENPYGNYVVQYLLGKNIPRVTGHIIRQLSGNYVSLSMNKCGSNVVEKCLICASRDEAAKIIIEIMDSNNFLMVLQNSFGNYVVQKALEASKNMKEIQMKLERRIKDLESFLHSHPFGNRVLSKVMSRRHF